MSTDVLAECDRLMTVSNDPETNPFKSKYEAKDRLLKLRDESDGELPPDFAASPLSVRVDYRLGLIAANTEEPHNTEVYLTPLSHHFAPKFGGIDWTDVKYSSEEPPPQDHDLMEDGDGPPSITPEAYTISEFNPEAVLAHPKIALSVFGQLGILWSGRDEMKRALTYLLAAHALYDHLKAKPRSCSEVASEIEVLHTHHVFYLAQVWGALGRGDLSASCCQLTLHRQLESHFKFKTDTPGAECGVRIDDINIAEAGVPVAESPLPGTSLGPFDHLEWAKNAVHLSRWFQKDDLLKAARCLAASQWVLNNTKPVSEDADDPWAMTSATIHRQWGDLYTKVLYLGRKDNEEGRRLSRCDSATIFTFEKDSTTYTGGNVFERVDAISHQHAPLLDPKNCDSFEAAREVFKVGLGHYEEAKKYFVLDGFVSDHVAIVQEISQLYKHLATWEEVPKRHVAMHNRRVHMLKALLEELNQGVYNAQHKQMNYELGETHAAISEVYHTKFEQAVDKPVWSTPEQKAGDVKKFNKAVVASMGHFDAFLSLFRDKDGKLPVLEEDDLGPFLRAHFNIARQITKPIDPDPTLHLTKQAEAIAKYEWLLDFASKQDGGAEVFGEEMGMIKQMVPLLKENLLRLQSNLNQ